MDEMPRLTKFKQTAADTFVLEFNRRVKECNVVFEPCVPERLELVLVGPLANHDSGLDKCGSKIVLKMPARFEAQKNEYSIVLTAIFERNPFWKALFSPRTSTREDDSGVHFMEIVRQPSGWLKEKFDFEFENGYSILGRRNLDVKGKLRMASSVIVFRGVPDAALLLNQDLGSLSRQIAQTEELLIASKIVKTIWDGEVQDSPTHKPYSDFARQPFANKLGQIHRGEFPISCQGIRDMFLHASLAFEGLSVRAVNAFNHCSQFSDLIAYTHATAEVYVSSLQKWVLCDPWGGFVLVNAGGELVSADEIRHQRDHLRALPLIDQIQQYHTGSDKVASLVSRRPIEVDVNKYAFDDSGHTPDYATYFFYIQYVSPKLEKE